MAGLLALAAWLMLPVLPRDIYKHGVTDLAPVLPLVVALLLAETRLGRAGLLIGLSVARGYTSAVQERFGRERGCSHLEFLARAIGPAVVQSVTSAAAQQFEKGGAYPEGGRALSFLANTCHVFIEDGPGSQKIAAGWRPGMFGYPAPTVAEIRRRIAEDDSGEQVSSASR